MKAITLTLGIILLIWSGFFLDAGRGMQGCLFLVGAIFFIWISFKDWGGSF